MLDNKVLAPRGHLHPAHLLAGAVVAAPLLLLVLWGALQLINAIFAHAVQYHNVTPLV